MANTFYPNPLLARASVTPYGAKPSLRPQPFNPALRGEALKRFLYPPVKVRSRTWRSKHFEQPIAPPVKPGKITYVDRRDDGIRPLPGYLVRRKRGEPRALEGRIAKQVCALTIGGLGAMHGSKAGPWGTLAGGVLGGVLGEIGCDQAGEFSLPSIQPGIPSPNGRIDHNGNTINPHL